MLEKCTYIKKIFVERRGQHLPLCSALQHYKEACRAGWSSAKQGDFPFTPASLQDMYGSRRCVSTLG